MPKEKCKNCGCELDKDGSHLDEVEEDGIKYCDNFKFVGFVNNTPERHFKQCCCTKPESASLLPTLKRRVSEKVK